MVAELIVVDVVVVVVVEVVEVALRFGFDIFAIFLSSNYEVIQDTDLFELMVLILDSNTKSVGHA